MTGFYIHVPFCVRKCVYCDFYSLETLNGPIPDRLKAQPPTQTEFLDALEREIAGLPTDFRPDTLFIGGGTPTELADADLQRLLDLVAPLMARGACVEWTCESNPGTLTAAKARMIKDAGAQRMSMGVQSFDAKNLEFLGRIHDANDVHVGFALLRDAGFTNINLDLIYGIPTSDPDKTRHDIEQVIALNPEHVSCYCLTFEEGTPLMDMKQRGYVREVDGELEREQYQLIRKALRATGYEQYEISNFARPGYACRHNQLYWGNGEYIGCGPSAHSHWRGRRYANVRSLRRYCRALLNGESPVAFEETLDPEAKARETLVMGLRRLEGVSREAFRAATGFDYRTLHGDEITQLCAIGMLEERDDVLRLSEDGLYVSNAVFAELV